MTIFKPGDIAVYPVYGVGRIDAIETKESTMGKEECYVLTILNTGATIVIPVKTAERVGLRRVSTKSDVPNLTLSFNKVIPVAYLKSWNRRLRALQEKMMTGRLEDVIQIISALLYLHEVKGLSFYEETLLRDAEEFLAGELSIVHKRDREKEREHIQKIATQVTSKRRIKQSQAGFGLFFTLQIIRHGDSLFHSSIEHREKILENIV